jgi:hypothetical protein
VPPSHRQPAQLAPIPSRHVAVVKRRHQQTGKESTRTPGPLVLRAGRFSVLPGFFARLVAAGKPKMRAVGACMRKLVMVCYGVLKNRAPFDPDWASKKAP